MPLFSRGHLFQMNCECLTRGSNLALLCVTVKKSKLNRRAAPIKGAACSLCCGGSAGLTHYAISKFCSNLNAAVTAHHHVPNNVVMRVFNHKLINSCTQIGHNIIPFYVNIQSSVYTNQKAVLKSAI